ncbi:unnamed protein product [Arctogadus glacialis]
MLRTRLSSEWSRSARREARLLSQPELCCPLLSTEENTTTLRLLVRGGTGSQLSDNFFPAELDRFNSTERVDRRFPPVAPVPVSVSR